jgi:hypothetical protein
MRSPDPEEINQRSNEEEGVKVQCEHILEKLKALSNSKAVEGMARYGINPDKTCRVSIPDLRKLE